MRDYTKRNVSTLGDTAQTQAVEYDQGLRAHMLRVYNHMGIGLAITGLVAMLVAGSQDAMALIFGTPLRWVVMLAPLGFVLFLSFKVMSMRESTAKIVFYTYAAAMGLSLSALLVVYTGESIARTFFISASVFGAMSLYGYTTKKDLSGMGSFLFMGLIGLILASVVNMFMESSALQFAISAIGVLIFVGLTAYDTQKIKETYYTIGEQYAGRAAILGALSLYLDFINLFIYMLQFLGNRE